MIEMLIQNNINGQTWEISEIVADGIQWETSSESQPGKLTFKMLRDVAMYIPEGSPVSFKFNDQKVFFGYIFKVSEDEDDFISYTAFDQMRYLKNKDTYVFSSDTASNRFIRLCNDFKLKYRVDTPSWFACPPSVKDNATLFSMIEEAIDHTLINSSNWHVIYDDFGTLVFSSYAAMATTIFVGDRGGLTKFSYERSIDSDSFNQVKLVQENKETKKRDVYIVKDSRNISRWGLLQHFETVDEKANSVQIRTRAENLLKVKNRKTQKLTLGSLDGDVKARAGAGIVIAVSDLVHEGLNEPKYYMVTKATHTFNNNDHTMNLEVRLTI